MRLVGLIGGVSPESTEIYVRLLNRMARDRLGGERSANFIVWHLDYGRMVDLYRAEDWQGYANEIVRAGVALRSAGADGLMIGSNTSHVAAGTLADATGLPVIHIIDAVAKAIRAQGSTKPLLFGTPVTMSGPYYRRELEKRSGVTALTPDAGDQEELGRVIFDELCVGVVSAASKRRLLDMIAACREADGVILGCTELSMILSAADVAVPVFDTTALHAAAASAFAVGEG